MPSSADVMRGRTALVTGGSRGIGRATAAALGAAGAAVTIVSRNADALARAAHETGAEARVADVADEAAVAALLASMPAAPDVVVHAAGAFALASFEDTTSIDFDRMIAVNLRAAFLLVRAVLPAMRERGSGHIVSIGSVAGRMPLPGNAAYAASKYGLRGLHGVLDAELRGTNVRTTLVEPAATDTSLWDSVDRAAHPGLPERGAMMQAEAVAAAVMYAVTQPAAVAVRNIILERS